MILLTPNQGLISDAVPMDLASAAAELYALPPADFTATRDQLSADARRNGETKLATDIKKLRRPTASAWLVNQLVREQPDLIAALLELGDELRTAQSHGAGDRLRELSESRRSEVAAAAQQALHIGRDAGESASAAVATEVQSTLDAAVANPEAATAVQGGVLTRALSYSGFGSIDLDDSVAVTIAHNIASKTPARTAAKKPAAKKTAAKASAKKTTPDRQAIKSARESQQQAKRQVAEVEERVEGLHRQLEALEEHRQRLRKEATAAEKILATARRELDRAERAVHRAARG